MRNLSLAIPFYITTLLNYNLNFLNIFDISNTFTDTIFITLLMKHKKYCQRCIRVVIDFPKIALTINTRLGGGGGFSTLYCSRRGRKIHARCVRAHREHGSRAPAPPHNWAMRLRTLHTVWSSHSWKKTNTRKVNYLRKILSSDHVVSKV